MALCILIETRQSLMCFRYWSDNLLCFYSVVNHWAKFLSCFPSELFTLYIQLAFTVDWTHALKRCFFYLYFACSSACIILRQTAVSYIYLFTQTVLYYWGTICCGCIVRYCVLILYCWGTVTQVFIVQRQLATNQTIIYRTTYPGVLYGIAFLVVTCTRPISTRTGTRNIDTKLVGCRVIKPCVHNS